MATISLYSLERAKEIVDQFLADYINYYEFINKKGEESEDEEELEQDEAAMEQRFTSALRALVALFCDNFSFSNREAAEQHLSGLTSLENI